MFKMLENILKDFLGIDYRKEYKEINKGELREINLNDKADQAFIIFNNIRIRQY